MSRDGTSWWISGGACVDNLLHAAGVDTRQLGPRCVVQMPALRLAMQEVIEAVGKTTGADVGALVRYEPQEAVQRLFASFPALSTPRAEAMGFKHDGSAATLAGRATAE